MSAIADLSLVQRAHKLGDLSRNDGRELRGNRECEPATDRQAGKQGRIGSRQEAFSRMCYVVLTD